MSDTQPKSVEEDSEAKKWLKNNMNKSLENIELSHKPIYQVENKPNKSVEESNIIEKDGDYYIKFVAHEEVVKRNRQQTRKERDAELVEWCKNEQRDCRNLSTEREKEIKEYNRSLQHLINHLTTPDHE